MIGETVEELTPLIGTRPACRALGASPATSTAADGHRARGAAAAADARPGAVASASAARCSRCCTRERFVDGSPAQVWATLLDEGTLPGARERTMYRLLAAHHGGVRERRDQLTHPPTPAGAARRAARTRSGPGTSQAEGPGEVDVLPPVRDPRRVQPLRRRLDRPAARERQLAEGADRAGHRAAADHPDALTVHADRGTPMSAKPVAFLLADLGVTKTHSRPYTSTDNPYSEAQFKTLKYRPEFPARFDSIEHARELLPDFFGWYNHHHRHSGIGLMTPAAVHHGHAEQLHADRAARPRRRLRTQPRAIRPPAPTPPELPTAAWINKPTPRRSLTKSDAKCLTELDRLRGSPPLRRVPRWR